MTKISIIIPIYNTGKYLEECIKSVLCQSFIDFEIILVNDGSPDNAESICLEYRKKDTRIKYYSKQNEGVAIARNFGIEKARGEYIFCLDSDDTIEKKFLEKIIHSFDKSNAELVILGNYFCQKPKDIIGALPTCAFAVKKSFLDKYPEIRFIEGIQHCEEGLFSHELLALANNVEFCPDVIYNYRKHDGSSENTIQTKKIIKEMPIWFKILENFYNKYNLWDTHKLHLLAFIENEPFSLCFTKMNFSYEERNFIFDLIHKFIKKYELLKCKNINKFKNEYKKFLYQNNYYIYEIVLKNIVNKKIIKLIEKNDIISFDIFDTLLIRPYLNPYHLLDHIERYTKCKGFAQNRFNAEAEARKNSNREDIKYDEIYALVNSKYKDLKEIELQFEYTLLKQNSHIFDIYNYAKSLGKKIIFISDMYLPKDFLIKVLSKNGYDYFDDFYLSSEVGLAKYSGKLFEKFLNDYKINPSRVLHIGDSFLSDVEKPKKYGINTYHIPKISDMFLENKNNKRYAKLYKNNPYNLEVSIILEILSEKYLHNKDIFNNVVNYMYDFGYCIGGPIGYGFVKFILKQSEINNCSQLLFVARDGFLLKKITEILSDKFKTFYVYAQRILRSRILLNYGDQHNADLLLSVIDEQIPRHKQLKTFQEKKEYIEKNLYKMFDYSSKKKEEYLKYILSLGINVNKNTSVIDTGAATFSAQLLLENTLNKKLYGLYTIITNQEYAKENQICYSTWSSPEDIKNITSLIEFCFTSPELPVIDIRNCNPVYIQNPKPEEIYRNSLYPKISCGILDFVKDIHARLGQFEIEFSGKEVNEYIKCFCENLSNLDYLALRKVKSSSNSSHTEYAHNFIEQISTKRKSKFYKNIFSIHNQYSNNVKRKVLILFGIKIKF